MTLDQWIRSQPSRCTERGRGSPAVRDGRMSDTEFGALMAGPKTEAVSRQMVGMWRQGHRMPGVAYVHRIIEVTAGAVGLADLRQVYQRGESDV